MQSDAERLGALESAVSNMAVDLIVQRIVIEAIIDIHPDRRRAAATFQALLPEREAELTDGGFACGLPITDARQMRTAFAEKSASWLKWLWLSASPHTRE